MWPIGSSRWSQNSNSIGALKKKKEKKEKEEKDNQYKLKEAMAIAIGLNRQNVLCISEVTTPHTK